MRGHRPRPLRGAARLQEDDRLHGGGATEGAEEAPAVGDAFEITGDHPGLGIGGHRIEQIALVQVGLVAERSEEREADPAVARPVQDRHRQRPRVGDEGDAARLGHPGRERDVEAAGGPDPAKAIRAEHPDRLISQPLAQLGLAPHAFAATLPEAGRDHHRAADLLGHALLERGQDVRGGNRNHGQVYGALDIEQRAHRGQALHRVRPGVDRDDPPPEARRTQVGDNTAANLERIAGGADHRHAGGIEEWGERAAAHAPEPSASARSASSASGTVKIPTRSRGPRS